MAERKLVFLTTQLPFPPNSGGTIKSYRLIEFFAQHFDLVLFTLLKNEDAEHLEQFRNQFPGIKIISHKQQMNRSAMNYLKSFFANKTLNEYRNWSSSFFLKVSAELNSNTLVFADHFEMYQYLPKDFNGKVVLHEHNAEWMLWERFAAIETNPIKRIVLKLEASRIKKKEVQAAQNSTLTFAAPNDRIALINAGVAGNKVNETYHLGNDELLNLSPLIFDENQEVILFLGTLSWEANIDGLVYFLEEVFPIILEHKPNTIFNIVGKNPDKRIRDAAEKFVIQVVFKGFVPSIEDAFSGAKVFVLPLRFGSGMKVKFLDAMYRGLPIVSTTIGAESIDVENGREASITDDPKEFAAAVIELLEHKKKWEHYSHSQRILAKEKYTWKAHLEQIHQALLRT